ncbi:MAG: hypothetical protein AAB787_01150 [Patescibacteria group bacterium]
MSKKGYIIGAIVLVVIVLFILLSGGNDKPEVVVKSFSATIAALNESGLSGTARVTDSEGKAKVVVNLTGTQASAAEPAHLHIGTCTNLGEPKYALSPIVNGVSETVLDVSVDEVSANLPLALNIHKSETEMDANIACGDLVLDSAVENKIEDTVPTGDETPLENPEIQ